MILRARCRPPPTAFHTDMQIVLRETFSDVGGELRSVLGSIRVNYVPSRGDSAPAASPDSFLQL